MTNKQVAEAFASDRALEAGHFRSVSNKTMVVLYSYATPVAFKKPNMPAVFDEKKYSVTTSKQTNLAKQECPGYRIMDHDEFQRTVRNG